MTLPDRHLAGWAGFFIVLLTSGAFAGPPAPPGIDAPGGQHLPAWLDETEREGEPEAQAFTLINYFFTRATATNMLANPLGLKGVSLGPLGLTAGSKVGVDDERIATYIEQRWIPVLSYSPPFADNFATFRAHFEIDYTWGFTSNAVGQNQGGGINADQVNIQTRNVHVAITPLRDPRKLTIIAGTQSVYDTPYDPTITSVFDIVRTGYKLSFFGTEMTGLSLYSRYDMHRWKLGWFPLRITLPNTAEGDPSFEWLWLGTLDYALTLTPGTEIGLSYWHLSDETQGSHEVYPLVTTGPGGRGLSPYTGVRTVPIDEATGDVHYLGVNFNHNLKFNRGPLAASGFVLFNTGRFESQKDEIGEGRLASLDVGGLAADLELAYNWGHTRDDVITLHGIFTTGDEEAADDQYDSVFTLNYYGLPGAVFFDHKTLLLFPFTSTISNYTGAVSDISNQGHGITAAIATAAWDVIPHTLNLKLGAAFGRATVDPAEVSDVRRTDDGNEDITRDPGQNIGFEVNAEVKWHLRYLMTVGLHVGYLKRMDFYADHPRVTADPWAAFTTFTWYAF